MPRLRSTAAPSKISRVCDALPCEIILGIPDRCHSGVRPEDASDRRSSRYIFKHQALNQQRWADPLTSQNAPCAMNAVTGLEECSPQFWASTHLGRGFLYGPRTGSGEDKYVLCEIIVSSMFAIPDQAPAAIARLALSRLRSARRE